MHLSRMAAFAAFFLALAGCTKQETPTEDSLDVSKEDFAAGSEGSQAGVGLQNPFLLGREDPVTCDTIPDFSRVGYKWGERDFPDYSNIVEVPAPTGGDDTKLIQSCIDKAPANSTVLLKEGTYQIDSIIVMDRSGIILRGAGNKATTLFARGKVCRDFIFMGRSSRDAEGKRVFISSQLSIAGYNGSTIHFTVPYRTVQTVSRVLTSVSTPIVANAYCGADFVEVRNTAGLSVGDMVSVFRPGSDAWIHAIHMDEIIKAEGDEDVITQWTASSYSIYWDRRIVAIDGNRVYLDNPVVMSMTDEFGNMGSLIKSSWSRVHDSGIENLVLESDYDATQYYGGYLSDDFHACNGIMVKSAEHCWVKDVEARHFSSSAVELSTGAQYVTVQNCRSIEPVCRINGGWRYAFHISTGQCCLVRDCYMNYDRHGCVNGAKDPGPNVFYNCVGEHMYSVMAPHQRWATGILYDNIVSDHGYEVADHGNSGTGHGWVGANIVAWNCRFSYIVCQNPWTSAKNYSIGCTPRATAGSRTYPPADVLGPRPLGVVRDLAPGEPSSLYMYQLNNRLASGKLISPICK